MLFKGGTGGGVSVMCTSQTVQNVISGIKTVKIHRSQIFILDWKINGKGHPRTGHEGPKGE